MIEQDLITFMVQWLLSLTSVWIITIAVIDWILILKEKDNNDV